MSDPHATDQRLTELEIKGLYAVSCGMRQSQRATAWVNG